METKMIKGWRKENEVLLAPMTLDELKTNKTKDGMISAKLVFSFEALIDTDIDWLNDEASERITDSVGGLTDISYKIVGNTKNNEVILKVTGNVDEYITDEEEYLKF